MNNPQVPNGLGDFRNMLFVVWQHLGLPEPTPVQYDIAYHLQHGPRRSVIEAFRGVGKSWITVAYVLWVLLLDPQKKIKVVSASKNLADNFSTFCLQLINTMPILEHLRPRPGQRDSKIQFDVGPALESKDPSVSSVGITGQITGSRADLLIADDIESLNNSLTQTARDRLKELIKEFDAVLKPGGKIQYLGTPQTEMSIYNALPSRGYDIRVWPARFPTEKERTRAPFLAPYVTEKLEKSPEIAGEPTDPRRFSSMDLAEREASYGRSGFALQFQLDTSLSDANRYPLKLSDLIVMDINAELAPEKIVWAADPVLAHGDDIPCVGFTGDRYYRPLRLVGDHIPYAGSVLVIDPSGRGSDECGYCIAKQVNGYIYIPEAGGKPGGYGIENLQFLAGLARKHKVNHVIIEANFGDGMFTELFKPVLFRVWDCFVEEVKHSKQKEHRICDTLEPVMNSHKLVVDPSVIRADYDSVQSYSGDTRSNYMLFHQLSRITRERGALRHDDRLDALAMAVAYWVQALAQDDAKKIKERQDDLMQRELDKFIDNALGRKAPKTPGWLGRFQTR
jgi:hypothetical protein